MKKILSILLIMLSLLGIADAGYLTYEKLVGKDVICGNGFDCGTVLQSEWSSIGSIPLSALGLLFYSTIFILSSFHLLEFNFDWLKNKLKDKSLITDYHPINWLKPFDLLLILSSFGFLFSLYLIFLMAVVIDAWCFYCIISASLTTLIFLTSLLYFFISPHSDV